MTPGGDRREVLLPALEDSPYPTLAALDGAMTTPRLQEETAVSGAGHAAQWAPRAAEGGRKVMLEKPIWKGYILYDFN